MVPPQDGQSHKLCSMSSTEFITFAIFRWHHRWSELSPHIGCPYWMTMPERKISLTDRPLQVCVRLLMRCSLNFNVTKRSMIILADKNQVAWSNMLICDATKHVFCMAHKHVILLHLITCSTLVAKPSMTVLQDICTSDFSLKLTPSGCHKAAGCLCLH